MTSAISMNILFNQNRGIAKPSTLWYYNKALCHLLAIYVFLWTLSCLGNLVKKRVDFSNLRYRNDQNFSLHRVRFSLEIFHAQRKNLSENEECSALIRNFLKKLFEKIRKMSLSKRYAWIIIENANQASRNLIGSAVERNICELLESELKCTIKSTHGFVSHNFFCHEIVSFFAFIAISQITNVSIERELTNDTF